MLTSSTCTFHLLIDWYQGLFFPITSYSFFTLLIQHNIYTRFKLIRLYLFNKKNTSFWIDTRIFRIDRVGQTFRFFRFSLHRRWLWTVNDRPQWYQYFIFFDVFIIAIRSKLFMIIGYIQIDRETITNTLYI